MSIRILDLSTGERFPMVAVCPTAPADPWITAYLLEKSRGAGHAWSTTHNKAKALDAAGRVCRGGGIPDADAVAGGGYPTTDQLRVLAQGLAGADGFALTTSRPYFDEFARLLRWVGTRVDPDGSDAGRAILLARFERAYAANRPHAPPKPPSPRYGLTEAERDAFFDVIIPDPGQPRALAFRDYAIGLVAFMLGLRSGEILGIKVGDVKTRDRSPVLSVVKRPNDPDDPRRRPAAQKTVGRDLPLSAEVAASLDQLVAERRLLEQAETHPYLIVNQYGLPLSDRGFRDVYLGWRRRDPNLNTLINHVLRHDWNDRWNDLVDARGWDREEALRLRKHQMGWSEGSSMHLRYGRRSQESRSNERLLAMQERGFRRYGQ